MDVGYSMFMECVLIAVDWKYDGRTVIVQSQKRSSREMGQMNEHAAV